MKRSLEEIQKIVGERRLKPFSARLEEGYDVPDDTMFEVWKILHLKRTEISHINDVPQSTMDGDLTPIIEKVLKYPEVQQKNKKQGKR